MELFVARLQHIRWRSGNQDYTLKLKTILFHPFPVLVRVSQQIIVTWRPTSYWRCPTYVGSAVPYRHAYLQEVEEGTIHPNCGAHHCSCQTCATHIIPSHPKGLWFKYLTRANQGTKKHPNIRASRTPQPASNPSPESAHLTESVVLAG